MFSSWAELEQPEDRNSVERSPSGLVGSKKDLSTQASSVQGRAKSMELPPQNISEGIKPNKLIYGTCLATCGRVLATALTSHSIYSQAVQANGVC